MKSLISNFVNVFRPELEVRSGIVNRVGPWFGAGDIQGLVLLLDGDPTPYIVLRDDSGIDYPAGLTAVGDRVTFESSILGRVPLSTFRNSSLDALLSPAQPPQT